MDFCEVKRKPIISDEEKNNLLDPVKNITNKRPDITFLISVISIISFIVLIYYLYPYIAQLFGGEALFTSEQYLEALSKPESTYSVQELARVRLEKDSLKRYYEFFDSKPYSLESQGIDELARGVIFLPILSFLIIYIVPPIICAYILWFVFTYWIYVIEALWGWFVMIYTYSTTLIECKLASKWYIRMVTGWKSCNPIFSIFYDEWLNEYVKIPIYYEKLKYIQAYNEAKEKYYTIPKIKYVTKPIEKGNVELEFVKKTFWERTMDNFISKLGVLYNNLYLSPRDRLYEILLEFEQKKYELLKSIEDMFSLGSDNKGKLCKCDGKVHSDHNSEDYKKKIEAEKCMIEKEKINNENNDINNKINVEKKKEHEEEKDKIVPECVKNNIKMSSTFKTFIGILILSICIFMYIKREILIVYTYSTIVHVRNFISKIL